MTNVTAADILYEIDFAISQTRKEANDVVHGLVVNPAHPNPMEYLYFLRNAEKAFHGMRTYLRSDEFVKRLAARKTGETHHERY